jgi:hypothetical protein
MEKMGGLSVKPRSSAPSVVRELADGPCIYGRNFEINLHAFFVYFGCEDELVANRGSPWRWELANSKHK